MKLKFKQQYISITQFEPVEINNFSILTGKNGSGKTHFLNAIKHGHVEIEGIDKSEIVYYNYNDFTVFSGNLQQNPQFQNRISLWNSESNQFLNKIQSYKSKAFNVDPQKRNSLENSILSITQQPNFNFEMFFGNPSDYELIKEFKGVQNIQGVLVAKQQLFTPQFFQFLRIYFNTPGQNIDDITYDKLKSSFINLQKSFEESLQKENEELFNFLKSTVQDKNIFNLTLKDFESPNFFLEDIANEEKEYQLKKIKNILNKLKSEDYNDSLQYLSPEKFIKKNGLSPIEQINNVLLEYNCNGYFLYTNPNQEFLGIDIKNIKVLINLKHKEKGYSTNFEQLSSGEKTLIALSLFIYKTRKNRIIPRVLLLDEIDSSLHPSMINRLLSVLENLFINEQGFKVILATHSPTTVALSPEDSIYIIEKNGEQKIRKELKSNAINILTEGIATINEEDSKLEINYNISQTTLPVLFTEGITDKIILETAWLKLYDTKLPFFIQDCFDASFLGNLFRRAEDVQDGIFVNYPEKIFIALFDFDKEGYNVWNGLKKKYTLIEENPKKALSIKHSVKNAYAILLPVPENTDIIRQVIKSGNETYENESILSIELLFYGIESLDSFFKKEQISGGGEIVVFKGKKREFANDLRRLNKDDFKNLIPFFNKLNEIMK